MLKTTASGFKASRYLPNGEGRDIYISSTNGGLFLNEYPYRFKEESRVQRMRKTQSIPRLDSKPVKYRSDGSGRDTYVIYNHGGLFHTSSKSTFYSNLRAPTPVFLHSRAFSKKKSYAQQKLVARLSVPKKFFS